MSKTYRTDALAAIHGTASDLRDAGVMDKRALRRFDELCLTPVRPMATENIPVAARASASAKRCPRSI
jgi:putative transcriptional regulator